MKFKLMTYNVQDLFLETSFPLKAEYLRTLSDEHWALLAEPHQELKPLSKLHALAEVILEESADCVCLCEVGGAAALNNFNQLFLAAAYEPFLIPGNSDRGIENAFLLKKDLPLSGEIVSHRDWPVPFKYLHEEDREAYSVTALIAEGYDLGDPETRKLSRDVPALHLYDAIGERFLTVLLAHLKSGYDPNGFDPCGQTRRAAEVRALVDIYRALSTEEGSNCPVIVAGDFNGNASRHETAPEFLPIYVETDLEDVLELTEAPRHARHTHVTFYANTLQARQLDYIFLPERLGPRLIPEETYVYRYASPKNGNEAMIPFSFRDRSLLPSDHYPVCCTLELP